MCCRSACQDFTVLKLKNMPYSLRAFIGIWFLYFLFWTITPAHSLTSEMGQVLLLDMLFVLIISVVAILTHISLQFLFGIKNNKKYSIGFSSILSRRILTLTLLVALIGLMALIFDKIAIQKINYLDGLAGAREEWRRLGEARKGASSLYSMIGYLLSSSFIITLIPIVMNTDQVSVKRIRISLMALFFLMMANSILIGGRSIILITMAFAFAFYSIRLERGGRKYHFSRGEKMGLSILLLVSLSYVLYIFQSRASATHGGVIASTYLESMHTYMGMRSSLWPADLVDAFPRVGTVIVFAMLAVTYLSHSASTFAEYLQHQSEYTTDSMILLNHIRGILSKLGLIDQQNTEWFMSGRFPSLPGALFHDGGYLLLFTGTLTLGFLTGIANYYVRAGKISFLKLGFVSSIYTTLFLSPLLFVGDILSFPFIVLEFIMFGIIFIRIRLVIKCV